MGLSITPDLFGFHVCHYLKRDGATPSHRWLMDNHHHLIGFTFVGNRCFPIFTVAYHIWPHLNDTDHSL